jgi:hypothetical protein
MSAEAWVGIGAICVTVLFAAGAVIWFMSGMDSRLKNIEQALLPVKAEVADLKTRVAVVEAVQRKTGCSLGPGKARTAGGET